VYSCRKERIESSRFVSEAHLETFAIFFDASTLFTVATTGVLRGFDLERSDDQAGIVICRLGGSAGMELNLRSKGIRISLFSLKKTQTHGAKMTVFFFFFLSA
jgi:hypothetical protein